MFDRSELLRLSEQKSFNLEDFAAVCQDDDRPRSEAFMRKKLQELLKAGEVVRVGRNAYCVPTSKLSCYQHEYSEYACHVANIVRENYPTVAFTIFELVQLNEFINHQLADNVLFLSVEDEIVEFVFDTMKERFPGKVLLAPTLEIYHQYWYEDMIVVDKLITEAPKSRTEPWHTRLEKMLVDLLSSQILLESISESEIPVVLEDAFSKYVVDESCLFRYAKRRGIEKRLRTLIREKTNITLRTE